jgi:hypothetical protein
LPAVEAIIGAVTTSASTRRGSDRTFVEHSVGVKVKLAGLWAAMMLLYVYADILSLFRPGEIADIESGKMGPFDVSQSSLVIASLIVILPALMIALSLTLRASINRPANLALACCSPSSTSATYSARAGSTTSCSAC